MRYLTAAGVIHGDTGLLQEYDVNRYMTPAGVIHRDT